ncbi:MAG: Gfo/Idh/MocA family oxidoreductase [Acidobacteria bacterium]|nr:Gfo/Idh/MocA family oxidoreductase [Acidobacteriota bacterium]MCI0723297.1 Gfo/Idh/MocA family oxidoreductase [Acidobacteriota bacterium]
MKPLTVALLGCGGIAVRYRKTYARLYGVRVAVTIDVEEKTARQAQEETGAAHWSTRADDAFASGIDAVVISTPNYFHKEHALGALKAGKHILLQKPIAPTVRDAEEILVAYRKTDRVMAVYMNLLDHPLFWDLRELVRRGYFGRVGLASARLAHRGGLTWTASEKLWRASVAKTGGGSFIQLGVHYLHLLQWILQDAVFQVQAFSTNLACPHLEGDDLMLAHLKLRNGTLAELETSWCVQEEHFSLMGTQGAVHYRDNRCLEIWSENGPFEGKILRLKGDGKPEHLDPLLPPEWDDEENPLNQHRQFVEALQSGRSPEVSVEQGMTDLRIVEACYESARSGVSVKLPGSGASVLKGEPLE